eukprot:906921-Pyramimonas_sp.AAC.2
MLALLMVCSQPPGDWEHRRDLCAVHRPRAHQRVSGRARRPEGDPGPAQGDGQGDVLYQGGQ